ncbi:MAG: Hsp20/alpha crystallin family protein [Planctomycetes bacterium]|nr:Hsp20/alpha crystallin family protein [Planctomycetota bacterium]NOG54163.1 Hsp20/alpha crystallin family protein [Planctomycetota bacterium]
MVLTRARNTDPLMAAFGPFGRLIGDLDRELDAMRSQTRYAAPASPLINLWEDDRAFHLEAEVPGLTMESLEITVEGDELTISGKRELPCTADTVCHRRERIEGAFKRSIRLATQVKTDEVEASLKNGVLAITLPKSEQALPRRIEVKAV